MRREKGDSHSKSGIVLVHRNQKHVGFLKILKANCKTFVIIARRKVVGLRIVQKEKKDAKSIKLDKKLDAKKSEHGNIVIYHNGAFVITTLLMFTMEHDI